VSSFNSVQLQHLLDRLQAGDETAANDLLRSVGLRLELLARKMLRGYGDVRRHADTNDVLQNALLRLLTALETVSPGDTRAFFNLAARQMRWELLDLTQQYRRSSRLQVPLQTAGTEEENTPEPAAPDETDDLERWERFHQEAERLPVAQREVLGLVFYHGWEQAEVAELLGVSVRTVQRYLADALAELRRRVRESPSTADSAPA
jgi:RNA polymerase sigma factor (sigma-70 family)